MRDLRVRLDRWDAPVIGYAMLAALCRPLTVEAAAAVFARRGVDPRGLRASRPRTDSAGRHRARRRPGHAGRRWLVWAAWIWVGFYFLAR